MKRPLSASDWLSTYLDLGTIEIESTKTTSDAPNNHLVARGNGLDGVVRLHKNGQPQCTGTLLTTGRHILTAAHCLDGLSNIDVVFEMPPDPSADVVQNVPSSGFMVHPNWNGNLQDGSDIAILELPNAAPADAERFDIYRQSNEIPQVGARTGYGISGQGMEQGLLFPAGDKRNGVNRYERLSGPNLDILMFDFDSGDPANDTFGLLHGLNDLGEGDAEVMTATVDSGGPTLLGSKVAGVTSFRAHDVQGDSDGFLNSSFGEFGGDTRVSAFAAWIDSVVDIVGPQVIDVDIAGSISIHTDYDVPVGSGQQLYTIPIGGADTFRIQFSEHVMIDADDFALDSAINTTKSYALAARGGFSYDLVTHTATFVLAQSFSGSGGGADPQPAFDQVVLTIADSVTDTVGNFLDGNWTNPTEVDQISSDVFPSGDDSPGGSFGFYLTFMPADHNFSTGSLQNKIDQGDHDAVLLNWGQNSRSLKNGDGTGEGDVDQEDLDQVLLNSGLDYTMWPGVSGMQSLSSDGSQTTSGTVWTVERRQTALDVLDSAFTRLDMEEVWKSLDVNEEVLLTSDLAWETFRDDLAAALDAYYGVSTKD